MSMVMLHLNQPNPTSWGVTQKLNCRTPGADSQSSFPVNKPHPMSPTFSHLLCQSVNCMETTQIVYSFTFYCYWGNTGYRDPQASGLLLYDTWSAHSRVCPPPRQTVSHRVCGSLPPRTPPLPCVLASYCLCWAAQRHAPRDAAARSLLLIILLKRNGLCWWRALTLTLELERGWS